MHTNGASRESMGLPLMADDPLDRSGLLGTRRGWSNINRYEVIFLILGILAACVTDILTIIRLFNIDDTKDPDLAYGILILVHSLFLLLFLITGIFYQRITDIIAFFLSAVLLTTYVIVHFVTRLHTSNGLETKDKTVRLIRLIFTVIFNILFLPLALYVIRDYRRDEFSKRVLGAFLPQRLPLIIYNIFDCLARINTMLSISSLLLNLYNFNGYETIDKVLLWVGIPLTFLWLGVGIGMVRLENYVLAVFFGIISCFQPGFLGYSLYSAIEKRTSTAPTIGPSHSTTATSMSPTITSESFDESSSTTMAPVNLIPVLTVLYVCIVINGLTHLSAVIFGFCCVKNFGKNLKELIFNNRFDKWFRKYVNRN